MPELMQLSTQHCSPAAQQTLLAPQVWQHSTNSPAAPPPGHCVPGGHGHCFSMSHVSSTPHMLNGQLMGVHELLEDRDVDALLDPEPLFELEPPLDVDPLFDVDPLLELDPLDVDPLLDPEPLVPTHSAPSHSSPSGQSRFREHLMAAGDEQLFGNVQIP